MTGESIRRLRKSLDLSQAQFASIVGVARETVARWEAGGNEPMKVFQDIMRNGELMQKRAMKVKQEKM